MIAWNSQMALDAGQYLFFKEASPQRIWRVTNNEGKEFILKLYRVENEMNSVKEGLYVESQHVSEDDEFNPHRTEQGSEWAFVENSVDQILNQYQSVEEKTDEFHEN